MGQNGKRYQNGLELTIKFNFVLIELWIVSDIFSLIFEQRLKKCEIIQDITNI